MKRSTFNAVAASLALGAVGRPIDAFAGENSKDVSQSLKAQEDRARIIEARALKPHYTQKFDLSGLPSYEPERLYTGWIRIHGSNYLTQGPLADYWTKGFQEFQPGIKLSFYMPTAAASFAALYYDAADLIMDHGALFYDLLAYQRIMNANPVEISAVTGSYDVAGWQNSMCIVANEANPIRGVTLDDIDGVFGAQRNGGWRGTNFHPEWARGPEGDIRRWDRLGIGGRWSGKTINTYGFSIRYATATEFSDRFLHGSDKWNENIVGFANEVGSKGELVLEQDELMTSLASDPFGIGYNRFRGDAPGVKRLPVSRQKGGPFVEHTIENVQSRSYPLFSEVFWYANPSSRVNPLVREFLRYALSRQGQEEVQRDGKYLPLTADVVNEQLPKLETLKS